ncbi:hypothetical protein BMI86_10150 [Thioclava sp. DLFJ5-1]|uniref:hypothetical protein n=1 Tax=Thioclava sp. DLFJ5-1 TaxID=1915314 RepID=UPI0009963154|nr:hypothetical protein [Thioclava sp. DLFJ5-1]OOY20859.1 hypothetical protein BMI86_10150 [Thioclava sp. DLFJ5-1]
MAQHHGEARLNACLAYLESPISAPQAELNDEAIREERSLRLGEIVQFGFSALILIGLLCWLNPLGQLTAAQHVDPQMIEAH